MRWEVDYVAQAASKNQIIAGFNVFGYEDALAVIHAAQRVNAPVLLMVNRDARERMEIEHWAALLGSLADAASVPVGIHLDHCTQPDIIPRAIASGFTSVMYDGSKLPSEQNLQTSETLAQLAHEKNVLLEVELGTVPYNDKGETQICLTDPEEAKRMQAETNADWLAVSVGNIHRLTGQKVHISFPVLQTIEQACTLPLVIHGSSGIVEEELQQLRHTHVGKMNFGTVLRQAFGNTLRKEMQENPNEFDRLKLFAKPIEQVEQKAYSIISTVWQEEK